MPPQRSMPPRHSAAGGSESRRGGSAPGCWPDPVRPVPTGARGAAWRRRPSARPPIRPSSVARACPATGRKAAAACRFRSPGRPPRRSMRAGAGAWSPDRNRATPSPRGRRRGWCPRPSSRRRPEGLRPGRPARCSRYCSARMFPSARGPAAPSARTPPAPHRAPPWGYPRFATPRPRSVRKTIAGMPRPRCRRHRAGGARTRPHPCPTCQ